MSIDPRAVVAGGAKLAPDVQVGAFAVIGPDVELGPGCIIGPHAVVTGWTRLGARNRVFQFASIGKWQPPQLVVQLVWQAKQAMLSSLCARSPTPGPKFILPPVLASVPTSLARAALAFKSG